MDRQEGWGVKLECRLAPGPLGRPGMKGGQRCPSVVALPCGYMSFPLFSEVWCLFSTPEDAFRIQATLIHVLSFWE